VRENVKNDGYEKVNGEMLAADIVSNQGGRILPVDVTRVPINLIVRTLRMSDKMERNGRFHVTSDNCRLLAIRVALIQSFVLFGICNCHAQTIVSGHFKCKSVDLL